MDATEFQDLYEYLDSDNKVYPSWLVGKENKGKRQQFSRKASKYSIRQSGKFFLLMMLRAMLVTLDITHN